MGIWSGEMKSLIWQETGFSYGSSGLGKFQCIVTKRPCQVDIGAGEVYVCFMQTMQFMRSSVETVLGVQFRIQD